MSRCETQLVSLEQTEVWNTWIPSHTSKKQGGHSLTAALVEFSLLRC
jgi:hypothetical protein